MDSEWSVETLECVALVTVLVYNPDPVDRRIRVRNELDGPVLPPRRQGVPEQGWDESGYEGVLASEKTVALGYACPAPVERPPVTIHDRGRARTDESDVDTTATATTTPPTPERAIRQLGRATPPRDAVPVARDDTTDETENDRPDDENDRPDDRPTDESLPASVEEWLVTVETRIERGEQLSDSVAAATDVLEAAGGLETVADLPERLAADTTALETVATRAERLAERAEETDVPVEALRRLA